jgi:hypothetical protein
MRRPTFRPSYANVTSTLALILATSGGAYAVTALPKDSVGTPQLQTGAVTPPKLAADAVTSGKVKNGALKLGDFASGQVFKWKGAWSETESYVPMDVVTADGSTWVASTPSTGVITSDTGSWAPLALAGQPGQDGQEGAPGQTGARGPSYGNTITANTVSLDPCGTTIVASLPLHLDEPGRVLGLSSGYWTAGNTPASWFINQSYRAIEVVDGSNNLVARTLPQTGSLTNGGDRTADLGVNNLMAQPTTTVPAGNYTIRLKVNTAADSCPSTYTATAWEVQFGYVIVGSTP